LEVIFGVHNLFEVRAVFPSFLRFGFDFLALNHASFRRFIAFSDV